MRHRQAVDKAVNSANLTKSERYLPLIALCRVLADSMDSGGPEVGTRLAASYLSALKDLNKAMVATAIETERREALEKSAQLRTMGRWGATGKAGGAL